jgi:hypothetical protein
MSQIHVQTKSKCLICEDSLSVDRVDLHKTRRQTHSLCLDCCVGYLGPIIKQITTKLIRNIRTGVEYVDCPGSYRGDVRNRCCKMFDLTQVKVPDDFPLAIDIFRISYVLSNPNSYICPNEGCLEVIETNSFSRLPNTNCRSCKTVWCRFCQAQPYHDNMSCIEYEMFQNNTVAGQEILKLQREGVVNLCPECKTLTSKNEGCNKMICAVCGTTWCWLCQEMNIDYYHYNPNSSRPCSNKLWK